MPCNEKSKTYENICWEKKIMLLYDFFCTLFHSHKYLETLNMCTDSDVSDVFWPKLECVHEIQVKVTSKYIYMHFLVPQDFPRL